MMNCKTIDLYCLLDGDDSSIQYTTAIEHLNQCEHCQSLLDSMTHSDQIAIEVTDVLRDSSEHAVLDYSRAQEVPQRLSTHRFPSDTNAQMLDAELAFLEPPRHAELLGRMGRYDIERVVGVGGTGIVLKAFDTELHRVVALKVLASHLSFHSASRLRFAREARAAAAILHPNVLPIYNVEAEGKSPFLVMQYIAGESLQSRVEKLGQLSIDEALRIAKQTAAALSAAHQQGLVHRDVKPANILLEDNTDRAVLSDFGLARTSDDAALTRTGIVAGTPQYMSPEQASGEAIDYRSDLFSLGSVLYFMLTGRPPFRGNSVVSVLHRICKYAHEPVQRLNHQVPLEIGKLIDSLLSKKPSQRFASANQVEIALEALLAKHQQGRLRLAEDHRWKLIAGLSIGLLVTISLLAWQYVSRSNSVNEVSSNVTASEPSNPASAKPEDVPIDATMANTQAKSAEVTEVISIPTGIELESLRREMNVLSVQAEILNSTPVISQQTEAMLKILTEDNSNTEQIDAPNSPSTR
jgi:eukaryotic-like serine/threonine-protein kinase